jgi:hypothetical protein
MSKELEALIKLANIITYEEKDVNHKETLFTDYPDEFNLIKQALTPPTEEEVCKTLSEWFNNEFVSYNDEECEFHIENDTICFSYIKNNEDLSKLKIKFEYDLPPHLITMIGKFYEGLN